MMAALACGFVLISLVLALVVWGLCVAAADADRRMGIEDQAQPVPHPPRWP